MPKLIVIDDEIFLVKALLKEADTEVVEVEGDAHLWLCREFLPRLTRSGASMDALNEQCGVIVRVGEEFCHLFRPIGGVGVKQVGGIGLIKRVDLQGAVAGSTNVVAGVAKSLRVRTEGCYGLRLRKVGHSKHKAVVLQARTLGDVHPFALQRRIGIKRPPFVNHTGYEVESKGRVDVVTTTLAEAAKPAEGAEIEFHGEANDLRRVFL